MTDRYEKIRRALAECRDIAMEWTMRGRIPECGKFGEIAQDLDAVCSELENSTQWHPITYAERDQLADALEAVPGEVEYEYEVWQGDALQAGGRGTDYASAQSEADHYAMMYAPEGPVEVRIYEKRLLSAHQQPNRRPYNASGSLSEYGVFPECDAQQPAAVDGSDAQASEVEALRAEVDALRKALGRILENEASDWKAAEAFGGYVLDDELREEARAALAKGEQQ